MKSWKNTDWKNFDEEAYQAARREHKHILRWTVLATSTPGALGLFWAGENNSIISRVVVGALAVLYLIAWWWYWSRPDPPSWVDDWLEAEIKKDLRREHRPLFSRRPLEDPGPPN